MIERNLSKELLLLANEYPVVTILGPRQSGKTTLARSCFPTHRYVNLEEPESRNLARTDPKAFFSLNPPPVVLDEVQRVPELLSWIQVMVDERSDKGAFVLTGSSQLALRASIAQSLAGRNASATLLPLTFSEMASAGIHPDRDTCILHGFFPRVHAERQDPVRAYRNYIQDYIERDVRQLLNVRNMIAFERFLGLLAGRVGQLVNLQSLAADTGVSSTTLAEWLSVLEASFVIYRLKPFFENVGKRLVKSPKLYFSDVGLAASLLGLRTRATVARDPLLGGLFENVVVMEAVKQCLNRGEDPPLYFYRDQNGREIDLILDRDRALVPIEIKASMTWTPEYSRAVRWFRALSPRAVPGMVVYAGDRRIDGDGYSAVPFGEFTI